MSEKYIKTRKYLNYVEKLFILVSTNTGCVSISAFDSLVLIHKSTIKKKKKRHDKIVLLGKDKLNTTGALISKTLIDSYISHDQFISVNSALKENNMKRKKKYKILKILWNVLYEKNGNLSCQLQNVY